MQHLPCKRNAFVVVRQKSLKLRWITDYLLISDYRWITDYLLITDLSLQLVNNCEWLHETSI